LADIGSGPMNNNSQWQRERAQRAIQEFYSLPMGTNK